MSAELQEKLQKLMDEEFSYCENSQEIKDLLVAHLVSYSQEHPSADHNDLQDILGGISEKVSIYITECIDIDKIIIEAREQTVDEKKLVEEGIVLTAQHAKKLSESFREEYEALQLSGLERFKLRAMNSIQDSILKGKNDTTFCFHNVNGYDDYRKEMEIVKWLQDLGYTVRKHQSQEDYEIWW